MTTEVIKEDFEAYVEVQKSGATNMCDIAIVAGLSGLSVDMVRDIMKNYKKYEKEFS